MIFEQIGARTAKIPKEVSDRLVRKTYKKLENLDIKIYWATEKAKKLDESVAASFDEANQLDKEIRKLEQDRDNLFVDQSSLIEMYNNSKEIKDGFGRSNVDDIMEEISENKEKIKKINHQIMDKIKEKNEIMYKTAGYETYARNQRKIEEFGHQKNKHLLVFHDANLYDSYDELGKLWDEQEQVELDEEENLYKIEEEKSKAKKDQDPKILAALQKKDEELKLRKERVYAGIEKLQNLFVISRKQKFHGIVHLVKSYAEKIINDMILSNEKYETDNSGIDIEEEPVIDEPSDINLTVGIEEEPVIDEQTNSSVEKTNPKEIKDEIRFVKSKIAELRVKNLNDPKIMGELRSYEQQLSILEQSLKELKPRGLFSRKSNLKSEDVVTTNSIDSEISRYTSKLEELKSKKSTASIEDEKRYYEQRIETLKANQENLINYSPFKEPIGKTVTINGAEVMIMPDSARDNLNKYSDLLAKSEAKNSNNYAIKKEIEYYKSRVKTLNYIEKERVLREESTKNKMATGLSKIKAICSLGKINIFAGLANRSEKKDNQLQVNQLYTLVTNLFDAATKNNNEEMRQDMIDALEMVANKHQHNDETNCEIKRIK